MRLLITSLLLIFSVATFAQKLEYQVQFHGIGDNREFFSGKAHSQTILGERTSFEIGTTVEENHQFRVGLDHLFEFGSEVNDQKPILTAYYHYADEKKTFYFGSFPRMGLLNFPLALLTDTLNYYRPNLQGMYGRYDWDWGFQSGFVDWTSRQTDVKRETFLAGFSGEMRYRSLFFENYLIMFHYAGTAIKKPGENIKDNLAMAFFLGSNLEKVIPLQKAYIKAGVLQSSIRERSVDDGYITGWSFNAELYGESKYFALRATVHEGDGQNVTNGDQFYRVNNYIRTDIYWKFINGEHIQGKFNLSFHLIEGNDLDQSQQISILYRFGNKN